MCLGVLVSGAACGLAGSVLCTWGAAASDWPVDAVEVLSPETVGVLLGAGGEGGGGAVGCGELSAVAAGTVALPAAVPSSASAETGKSASTSVPARGANRWVESERIMVSCRAGS